MDIEMIRKLAKTELHCHLDGSLSLPMIRQLADLAQISLPEEDQELKKLVTAPLQCQSLMDYLKTFDVIRPLLQTSQALTLATYDVIRQAAQENVIYIEIRFAPELSMDQGLSASQVVEAVLAGIAKAEADFPIMARAIVCGLRQSSLSLCQEIFSQSIEWANKGLVGFDFAGNEADFPPGYLAGIIKETQKLGLPFTLHAGECGCPQNINDSIDLGIKRLGHATAIQGQKELLDKVLAHGVCLELCLTSNLQTKAAKTITDFPYLFLEKAGARISINTDNRTVSDTNLSKEYQLYQKHFATTVSQFYQHNQAAIEASFTSKAEKKILLKQLALAYDQYL